MSESPRHRIVPWVLGGLMVAVVAAAALLPSVGAVSAASNCPYNNCPSTSSSFPTWELISIGGIVIAGILAGLFILMRRRRRPPSDATMAASGGAGVPPSGASMTAPPPPDEAGAASYVESPDDVGAPPPTLGAPVSGTPAAAGAGAAGGAAAGAASGGESEPDIDSLMAELDKISGEILKRAPKKGSQASTDEDVDDATSG